MFLLMATLTVLGLALFLSARLIARIVVGREGDSTPLTRMLQAVAIALLIAALLARPHNPDTSAIPPHPDEVPARSR